MIRITEIKLLMTLPHSMCRWVMCWGDGDITGSLIKRHPVEVAEGAAIEPGTELLLVDHAVIKLPSAPYMGVFSDIAVQINDTRLYLKLVELSDAEPMSVNW